MGLKLQDKVRHTDFPPFEGFIVEIQDLVSSSYSCKLAVSDGNRIFYDYDTNWELVDEEESTTEVWEGGKRATGMGNADSDDIVDVEYTTVDE